ncbi:peroxidase 59-like [Hibiscus syriacus]|uniref:RING-type E3 ubiquitin transferase n=1 Tax=Hibiscus syriacus TaxID=106335 RepID=A0A6A3D6D4_HIBSY|nr:peroxidase 59-like [Hibiscus syriacus]
MASSLEELLAEEGFRGRTSVTRSILSVRLEASSKSDSAFSNRAKTERTRSDVSRYSSKGELSSSDSTTHRRPRDYLIIEVGVEETERVKDVFANVGQHSLERRDKRKDNASTKYLLGRRSYSDTHRNNLKLQDAAFDNANRGSRNRKSLKDGHREKHDDPVPTIPQPALDEVAVQAIVSILCSYIKRFLREKEFRNVLRLKCFSSLDFIGLDDYDIEDKVILNLEQAIETVEKAVTESISAKELKKASLQLRVITGLNSNDLKDSFTSGFPNAVLSSCAHLYLSVIYKLQKKDRVSARHLLQVFRDSPSQARTNLLPELWDDLFRPHLSHLEAWYYQEASSLSDAPSRERKLKLIEKVYNETLDSSTYQLASYYKDWLTEGIEAPSFPSIHVPSVFVQKIQQEDSLAHSPDLASTTSPFSPQPMVSKKLYDAVFGRSSKPGLEETRDNELHYYDTCGKSSGSSSIYVKQTLTCSSETVKYPCQHNGEASYRSLQDDASSLEDGISSTAEEEWRLPGLSMLQEKEAYNVWKTTAHEYDELHAPVPLTANELILKRLAKSAFQLRRTKITDDLTLSGLPNFSGELYETYGCSDEESLISSIHKDFICPLTGKLFEDPVTLETGQTFERVAIKEWFNQGKKTFPVTGKSLDYLSVPHTNVVLKCVIDRWKSENCTKNLALAFHIVGNSKELGLPRRGETAVFILDQFLATLSKEERIMNTKHLISLGALPFLIQRFKPGNMEENVCGATLLSCCIEADSVCRYQIARDINKQCLFELVCSKQVNSRTNAVLLLTELICLSRRKDVPLLLSDLQDEDITNTMHAIHDYLQNSPLVQRPLVATLLLNIDLLVDPKKYGLYRHQAVDAITEALDSSLIDEEVREKCCRALLILGGRFSLSGKLLTEDWILNVAGFKDGREANSIEKEADLDIGDSTLSEDEEHAIAEWLRNLLASLVRSGNKSFLEAISSCLGSGNGDLVTACLATVAWLTGVLQSPTDDTKLQQTLCTLISQLKQNLESGAQVHHKIFASMSLLNLSKIPEYRVLLMTIAEDMASPLRSLADVTWTAKELHGIIYCTTDL